ncbi:hypothetical protein LENED_005902 [Lentinula edodes]|uniref:Uncharacterized protein n=1 Tax=Lentinula edodes TaxID=5353 RepID=A0A1Q3EA99_LENED|nr:hypothetical protein LENED_005902 [Lentinula edodes]
MHLSVSSLRFDGRDEYFDVYEPAKDSAARSILPAEITPSTSATPALAHSPSSASTYVSDTHNALDDFDLTYITSGLALSANAMSEDSHMPDAVLEDLDFVRKRPTIESVSEQRLEGDARTALVKRPQRGVPMGWEDDLSIPTLFSDATTEGSRARQATTIAAANLAGGVSSTLPQMSAATAGTSDASGSTQDKPRGPSAQRDLTAILDQSEINSANGMPNTVQLHASSVSSPSSTLPSFPGSLSNLENVSGTNSPGIVENKNTIRRKRSVFAGLGALGIGSVNSSSSRTKEAQAETSQPMSPVSPVSPVSPARTIKGEGQRMDLDWGRSNAGESSVDVSAIPGGPSVPLALDSSMVISPSMDLSTPHHSFAYSDSLARPLVVRGGPDSAGVRREWVIRKEVHSNQGGDGKPEIVKTGKDGGIQSEQTKDKDKADALTGMSIGTDEVWENFLLGKFHVVRDDMSPRIGKVNSVDANGNVKFVNGGGDKATEGNVLGFRVPLGKPPQQRLIIKHLREDNKSQVGHPVAIDPSKRQTKLPDLTVSENPPSLSVSYQALHSQHAAGSSHSSTSNTNSATIATSNLQSLRHDSHYPSILVHKHSKVAAFSINRQYRAASKESKESSSGRMRVVMLAPRDIQEAFTNTATTKKLGTVIDRHEAARVAFSPGHDQTVTDKKGKTKMKKHSSIYISSFKGKHRPSDGAPQVKSEGQIVLDHLDIEDQYLRQSTSKPSALAKNTGSVRDKSWV